MTSHTQDAPALIRYSVTGDGMLLESAHGPVVPFVDVQQLMGIICQALTAVNALQSLLNTTDIDKAACSRELATVRTALASACVARATRPVTSAQDTTRPSANDRDVQTSSQGHFMINSPAGNFTAERLRPALEAPVAPLPITTSKDVK